MSPDQPPGTLRAGAAARQAAGGCIGAWRRHAMRFVVVVHRSRPTPRHEAGKPRISRGRAAAVVCMAGKGRASSFFVVGIRFVSTAGD